VDEATLRFYRENAQAYAEWAKGPSTRLTGFLALLPPGGAILELGCGAGNHSARMLAAGFAVRATDGSPEMAEIASRRLGHPVETMLFHESTRTTPMTVSGPAPACCMCPGMSWPAS
jgi:2-polyprenyl-3-methyl-5-hydroxy-6-metoxy-1,4-benzoquinol methylase